MMNERDRNVVAMMAVDMLRTGNPPTGVSPEMEEAVKREVEFLKKVRNEMGEKEFAKVTIDVGYDYD